MLRKTIFTISTLTAIAALGALFWPKAPGSLLPLLEFDVEMSSYIGEKYGFINTSGRIVIDPIYTEIAAESDDHVRMVGLGIEKNGADTWRFANLETGEIGTAEWEEISTYEDHGLAAVRSGDRWRLIDENGEFVGPRFAPDRKPSPADASGYFAVRSRSLLKMGWVDNTGETVIPLDWDDVGDFDAHGMAPVESEGVWGWIHTDGRVIAPRWSYVYPFDDLGMALVADMDGKMGWVNREGNVVIKPNWDSAMAFDKGGLAVVRDENYKAGWIDRSGKTVIPFNYLQYLISSKFVAKRSGDKVRYTKESLGSPFEPFGIAVVQEEATHKWGAINRRGEMVIPFEWDSMGPFSENKLATVKLDQLWGWINLKGEVVVTPRWEEVMDFEKNGMIGVCLNRKWGWANEAGEVLIEPGWADIEEFDSNGFAIANKSEFFDLKSSPELIDQNGNTVIKMEEGAWEDFGTLFVKEEYYYLIGSKEKSWIRALLAKITHWIKGGEGEAATSENVLIWLTPEGEILFDSRSLTFEAKCWWMFAASFLVALLFRPRRHADG